MALVSCSSPDSSVKSITLATDGAVAIGTPEQVGITLKDSGGNVLTGRTVTWASSNPALATVDANGTVTARHLSLSRTPVTITASSEGQTASVSIQPYGLDVTGGAINDDTTSVKTFTALARFQGPTGEGVPADTDVRIQGPTGFNQGQPYIMRLFKSTSAGGITGAFNDVAVTGSYTATAVVNGVTYTKMFAIDTGHTLGFVTNPSVTRTGNSLRIQGTAPAGAASAYGVIFDNTKGYRTDAAAITSGGFDQTIALIGTPVAGTYQSGIYARDFVVSVDILPEDIRISFTSAPNIIFP